MSREYFVKDCTGTTKPRMMKFDTNLGYDKLYCVSENQPPPLSISFICPFFFLKYLSHISQLLSDGVFIVFIHLEGVQVGWI